MGRIEELKAQRKLIDEQIKILSGMPVYKRCKIDVETYPTDKPDRYYLAIKYCPISGRAGYHALFASNDRDEVIEAIPSIIEELQGLYDLAKTGQEYDK